MSNFSTTSSLNKEKPKIQIPAVGDLLVAIPNSGDPFFNHSVILILKSSNDVVAGVIINRKTDQLLSDISHNSALNHQIYLGGRVNKEKYYCLHNCPNHLTGIELIEGWHLIQHLTPDDFNTLDLSNSKERNDEQRVLFFQGHVVWKGDQLLREMKEREWHVKSCNVSDILLKGTDELWKRLNQEKFGGFDSPILPRIKVNYGHSMYEGDRQKLFIGTSDFFHENLPEQHQPIITELAGDLLLGFVEDKPAGFQFLQKKFFEEYPQLDAEILKTMSATCLVHEIGRNLQLFDTTDGFLMVTAGGNHEAAVFLIDPFMEHIHKALGDTIALAIPANDLLFICKDFTVASIERLKQKVDHTFDNPITTGLLSKGIYKRERGSSQLELLDKAF